MHGHSALSTTRVAATFAGTIIGAGFASGQELLQFFVVYGGIGLVGIALAGGLFAWLGSLILELGYRLRATSYHQLLYHLCGKKVAMFLDGIIVAFLFSVLTIMLAGAGTVFRDNFELPFTAGITALAVVVTLIVLRGVSGITTANMIATPILAAAIIGISAYSLAYHDFQTDFLNIPASSAAYPTPHWILSSLLYVSYNLVMATTVLAPLGAATPAKYSRQMGSIIGGAILATLACLVSVAVMLHYPNIMNQEIPMLYISSIQHCINGNIYTAIFIIAMFTTALASLYGCATKLASATGLKFSLSVFIVITLSIAFSYIGFATLINILFPIFGYATLWFLVKLVVKK
ncbi:YkvI family membrane protein [Dendrosporobacter sp. 1207_IL3150]|uniref:YkvI family membrane protein n=1 Tax=Dendrosporobacter sp. 1207_IL3150 TaxID=3084054 RepID=UPI002FDA8A05